jgi:hypothetical protein
MKSLASAFGQLTPALVIGGVMLLVLGALAWLWTQVGRAFKRLGAQDELDDPTADTGGPYPDPECPHCPCHLAYICAAEMWAKVGGIFPSAGTCPCQASVKAGA